MTEASMHRHQEAPAIAYVYSLGTGHPGQVVPVDPVNIFHEDKQTDWKSFFKHPPSSVRFTRNPSTGTRDSKRAVKIPPCTTTTITEPITSEPTREKPLPQILKVPPKVLPPPKTVTITKKLATRKASEEPPLLGGDVPPAVGTLVVNQSATDKNGGQLQQKLHDHSGSAGESTSESTSMSTSPTSQISNGGAIEDGNEDHEVFTNEDEVMTVMGTDNDTSSYIESSGDYFGQCCTCGLAVCGSDSGCVADDRLYHNKCFECQKCGHNLVTESFYVVQHEILCRKDYLLTLDKCFSCDEPVTDQVIHANDHAYHLRCFKCTDCGQCLDGIPYAIDCSDKIYCVKDYHRAFAPRCQSCEEPILPNEAEPNTKRLIAMNMNFHVGCYCCVECGVSLVSADDSAPQCFPIDQYPLCLECNRTWAIRRHSTQNSPAVTEQSSLSEQSIS